MSQPSARVSLYKGYRYPPEIISQSVWLYYRFAVSLRDVSELLLARGIEVSHEAVPLWTVRFGLEYARRLIQGAKHSLDVAIYDMRNADVLKALKTMSTSVQLQILYDDGKAGRRSLSDHLAFSRRWATCSDKIVTWDAALRWSC